MSNFQLVVCSCYVELGSYETSVSELYRCVGFTISDTTDTNEANKFKFSVTLTYTALIFVFIFHPIR